MKTRPRHEQISRELLGDILSGKHDATGRLPSEAQLVKRFGVSRPTVTRALFDLKNNGVIERRAGSGTFISRGAPTAAGTRQLGLLVPGLGEIEIFEVICGELASLARVHDLVMHWGGPRDRSEARMTINEAESLCDRYIERGLHGVFFAPFEHTSDNQAANRRITEKLTHAGISVVLLDRDLANFPDRSEFDLVGIDNFAAGYRLAEHLIKLGARRLHFVSRPFSASTVEARQLGASIALCAHGIEVTGGFMRTGDCADVKFVRQLVAGKMCDAIICSNDHTAAQLLQSLTRLGVRVPQQIRIVGFDDVRFATLLSVPLTTMRQPCRDLALTAFNAMLERMKNPTLPARGLILQPSLEVRESCGAYLK
ncbi:MAG TPA: GntR family transcriptional regulator [Candidatus Limnocylindria bacterium]|nr:GntR family transcriptional regulator [Candidatus Limnocylindria bacterium]